MTQIEQRDFSGQPGRADAALASLICRQLQSGLETRARASLVLSGGRTPGRIIPLLAKTDIAWENVAITLTDERWVALDDPASTQGVLQRMMAGTPMEKVNFFGLFRDGMALEDAPEKLSEPFQALFPDPFDVVFLGMGEDGHTASLFPGRPWHASSQTDAPNPAVLICDPEPPVPPARISLSPQALLNARAIGMIVNGVEKRSVLEQALAEKNESRFPIAIIGRDHTANIELYVV